jgi:8-amino-7-oxononanoate synthase
MRSLDRFAADKLAELESAHLLRKLDETEREDGLWITRGSQRLLSFSCNDYLNLTHHPALKAAAIAAIERYGVGSGASRLVTGNHPLFTELETRLARLKGTQSACVFGSGYLANAGIIPTLAGAKDLVLIDELAHSCLWAGTQLGLAQKFVFRHNNIDHVEAILTEHRTSFRHVLLVTDGVFSMDGDRAPLADLARLCNRFDCWLMTDDAHGLGVIGEGRGSAHAAGLDGAVPLQMGTLSKAIGAYGGYLCAAREVIDLIKTRARTFVYSTGLPPAMAGAAIAALDLIAAHPELTRKPLAKARLFTSALGLPEAQSPIVPLIVGAPDKALEAARKLAERGFLAIPIRPPTVPAGTARLRLAFTAGHSDADILRLAEAVRAAVGPAIIEKECCPCPPFS